jgi:lipopolysaccharide biosynthesis regulator YciM
MFDDLFSWLLLPVCAALGWALARRAERHVAQPSEATSRNDAIAGLGSLIRDDADEAITALTRAIEAEPGAVELQLTLGGLFRKRGEIDRAIRLHESMMEATHLTAEQSAQARLELARDYLKAGVVDRAESLAQSLLESPLLAGDGLEVLLDLYEQTRDWPQAISMARRWQAVRGRSAAGRVAQYHCELAETARAGGDFAKALKEAEAALAIDRGCVRASLLLGAIHEKQNDPAQALQAYARVLEQNPAYFAEALVPLRRCADATGEQRALGELLDEAEKNPSVPMAVVLAKAQWLATQGGEAGAYLATRLAARPDWEGLLQWIELTGVAATAGDAWKAMQTSLRKKLAAQPQYLCSQCGFKGGVLFWQCPSCKNWSTVKPAA